jgi:glycosyltransferase involved in cell wall biosynthesis
MNILFLTISTKITSDTEGGVYLDLLRKFRDHGHQVFVAAPAERRYREETQLFEYGGITVLKIKTLNFQKTNLIEKGISTLLLEHQYSTQIFRFFKDIKFDLILYSTPPITFSKLVSQIKKRDQAKSYLLLKDIFPQNAVDLGMMKKTGMIYHFFRRKEKQLYRVSDHIGCMSPANVAYVLKHNPEIPIHKVEVSPNSIAPLTCEKDDLERAEIRKKYNIPSQAVVVLYGGNLGKPQGLDFFSTMLSANRDREDCFFLIVGSGTEQKKLEAWVNENQPQNCRLLDMLPKEDYSQLIHACDIGLVMLDKRFTIPNFPSRILSYLECKMPVLVVTDIHSDMGKIAEENQFGLFSVHGDIETFNINLNQYINNRKSIESMGMNGYQYLMANYTVDQSYQIIMKHFQKK